MRAWAGLGRIGTAQLVEKPVRWRGQPLLMLLWTSTHVCGGVVAADRGGGSLRASRFLRWNCGSACASENADAWRASVNMPEASGPSKCLVLRDF